MKKKRGEKVKRNDPRRKDIIAAFKAAFGDVKVTYISLSDIDYFEQDMIAWADISQNGVFIDHMSLFLQFNQDGSITKDVK